MGEQKRYRREWPERYATVSACHEALRRADPQFPEAACPIASRLLCEVMPHCVPMCGTFKSAAMREGRSHIWCFDTRAGVHIDLTSGQFPRGAKGIAIYGGRMDEYSLASLDRFNEAMRLSYMRAPLEDIVVGDTTLASIALDVERRVKRLRVGSYPTYEEHAFGMPECDDAAAALRAPPRKLRNGRLKEGLRMELDVEFAGGTMCTYTYKLKLMFTGGNNAVYVPRVANIVDEIDVDAETLLSAARTRASPGEARGLSKESVAVLIHDMLVERGNDDSALDVASAVLECGLFTGRAVYKLVKRGNGSAIAISKRLEEHGVCSGELAAIVGDMLSEQFRGGRAHVDVAASHGTPPVVPTHEWLEDIVVRVQKRKLKRGEYESIDQYWREVRNSGKLSEAGLAPRTYARILMQSPQGVQPCVVLERFECSLHEIQLCPSLMRRMFVESDGEAALVDLYARSSGLMRCIDTKPANVVVRLPTSLGALERTLAGVAGKAARRAKHRRLLPRLALIDVDPRFCGDPSALVGRRARVAGASTVADLDAALAAFGLGDDSPSVYGSSPLLAAAMSLLIHCTVALNSSDLLFGFPYVAIARVLLARWHVVEQLVRLDEADDRTHAMVPGGGNTRVIEQLRRYSDAGHGEDVLEKVRGALALTLEAPSTNVLALCSGMGTARGDAAPAATPIDPVLYEYTELVMQDSAPARLAARRARSLMELTTSVEEMSRAGSFAGVRPACQREPSGVCAFHYHIDDTSGVQRALELPEIVDRPLLAQRPIRTAVNPVVDPVASRAFEFARVDPDAAATVASLMHDLVVGHFGDEVAVNVARAVRESTVEWSVERLHLLAQSDSLVAELKKLHVASKVARHIAAKIGNLGVADILSMEAPNPL